MFFPDLIKSIKSTDKVLEIGPGATPYHRANEFLELKFDDLDAAIGQRGNIQSNPDFGRRKVTYYKGGHFPFLDNEFDYVIASHVIEHVTDPKEFLLEIFRVGGGRGYIEFPLPTYDYLYDFDVHLNFIWQDNGGGNLVFLRKTSTSIREYATITSALRKGFEDGWDDLVRNNLDHFFLGFEFLQPFEGIEVTDLKTFKGTWEKSGNSASRQAVRRVESLLRLIPPQKI